MIANTEDPKEAAKLCKERPKLKTKMKKFVENTVRRSCQPPSTERKKIVEKVKEPGKVAAVLE